MQKAFECFLDFAYRFNFIVVFAVKPFRLCAGMRIDEKPSFSASRMRCSIRLTGRISPDSPTSPTKQMFLSIEISRLDDKMALITDRSSPGSFIRKPPAIFKKTSFCESLKPALFPILPAACSFFGYRNLWTNVAAYHRLQCLPEPEFRSERGGYLR